MHQKSYYVWRNPKTYYTRVDSFECPRVCGRQIMITVRTSGDKFKQDMLNIEAYFVWNGSKSNTIVAAQSSWSETASRIDIDRMKSMAKSKTAMAAK